MMNVDALFAIVILFALAGLYLGPWQSVCTAFARQVVFEKRDRLFDMATNGELRFDSDEYREIRASLEKLIRFAHELTLLNFVIVSRHMSRRVKRPVSELRRHTQGIGNPLTRKKVENLVIEAHRAVLMMMLAKSVVALPLALLWMEFRNMKRHTHQHIRQITKPYGEMVQIEAEAARINKRMLEAA